MLLLWMLPYQSATHRTALLRLVQCHIVNAQGWQMQRRPHQHLRHGDGDGGARIANAVRRQVLLRLEGHEDDARGLHSDADGKNDGDTVSHARRRQAVDAQPEVVLTLLQLKGAGPLPAAVLRKPHDEALGRGVIVPEQRR